MIANRFRDYLTPDSVPRTKNAVATIIENVDCFSRRFLLTGTIFLLSLLIAAENNLLLFYATEIKPATVSGLSNNRSRMETIDKNLLTFGLLTGHCLTIKNHLQAIKQSAVWKKQKNLSSD